uniref:Carboxypeptidase D n=2 Tax=Populus alba TaxID=43335 RepID=A0A4V6A8M9_POPAL|nr:carboxypeptidase D [Populus alba]
MNSSSVLTMLGKKLQKLASINRKSTSLPRTTWSDERTSVLADKGHLVVYTIDQNRFLIPLVYLNSGILRALFELSKDEFGLPSDGPITLTCDEEQIKIWRNPCSSQFPHAIYKVINAKKLIKLVRKWKKLAALSRKRITLPATIGKVVDEDRCSTSSTVEKGHLVVYSIDRKRFVLPLEYFSNKIARVEETKIQQTANIRWLGHPGALFAEMKIFFFFHLLVFSLSFSSSIARGPLHSSLPSGIRNGSRISYSDSVRRQLFQDKPSKLSDDRAKGYMTNSDLEKAVKEFGRRCSNISRIYSIGKSVLGVPLWVIEISDKPGEEEPEPAFKFIGNVHGDEPVGRELLLRLANWICDHYMKDSLARLIVENIHLHILPSMNPDGYFLRSRGNANNIDLNRDFPDQFFPLNNDINARQPETRAVMNWLREIQFAASASLHGGALVANYPWDGTEDKRRNYYACPDDDTFRFMASVYSHSHHNMSLSKEFPGGITNGAFWYPIYGGMQDWNYIHAGCFELTLEISENKWPNANELPTLWEYNKMSLLNLAASLVKTGIHGRIFSSDSGMPLPGSVTIKGINYTVKASRGFADYHRLLAPGERYEVMASMHGYKPKTTRISLEEAAMTLDFILDPEVTSKGSLRSINDCRCENKCGLEIFWRVHSEVYFILIVVSVFLCFLLKRKLKVNILNRRQLPKRSVQV